MTTFQDTGVSIAEESTYGTYVAGTRGLEVLADQMSQGLNRNVVQGQGFRVGSRFPRSARRNILNYDGTLVLPFELASKGMGMVLKAALGSAAVTLVSGSTYQHNFTVGDSPGSLSIQQQLVEAGLTVDDYSWSGCMVDSFELDLPNVGLPTFKATFDCQKLSTAQSHVAPSYKTEPVNLFHFSNLSFATGTFTAATTTTMPSAATSQLNIRGANLQFSRNLIKDRFNGGGAGLKSKPIVGAPSLSGTLLIEYDATTYRDLVVSDGSLCVVATYTAGALSTGLETFTVPIPCIKFDGELPQPSGDQIVVQNMAFTCLDDLTNTPFGIYMRTADSAV